jgi:hypothetical protein
LISQPSPSLVFLRILVYEMPLVFMFLIRRDMFVVRRNCLSRSGSPQLSPVMQVAVIPFEIDVSRHVNLDDFPGWPYRTWYLNSLPSSSPAVAATIGRDLPGIMRVSGLRICLESTIRLHPIFRLAYPHARRVFAAMVQGRPDAMIVTQLVWNSAHQPLIIELAANARLPAIYPARRMPQLILARDDDVIE